MVLDVTKAHYLQLFADGTQYAKFKQVASATPEFTFELVRAIGGLLLSVRAKEAATKATTRPLRPVDDLSEDDLSEEEETVQAMINSLDDRAPGYQARRTQFEARKVALVRRRRFGQGTLQVVSLGFPGTPQLTPVRQSGRRRR